MLSQQKMKNLIREKAIESNLPMQQLYGLYAMDRLVLKLSKSLYADKLIVKGGFLLTTELGISMRATRDLDFTAKDMLLDRSKVEKLLMEISKKDKFDIEYFKINNVEEIKGNINFSGYNLRITYYNGDTQIPINVDLTSGEDLISITNEKTFTSIFTKETYKLSSYAIEQILSDKFYTLLAYGNIDDTNSRMKDYYDIFLLTKLKGKIDLDKVRLGIHKNMKQRNVCIPSKNYNSIIKDLINSKRQREYWSIYSRDNPYAKDLEFEKVMKQIKSFSTELNKH